MFDVKSKCYVSHAPEENTEPDTHIPYTVKLRVSSEQSKTSVATTTTKKRSFIVSSKYINFIL